MIQGNAHISQQPTIAGWTLQEAPVHFTISGHAEPSHCAASSCAESDSEITDTRRINALSDSRIRITHDDFWVYLYLDDRSKTQSIPIGEGKTLREAIDAAIRNTP